MAKKHDQPPPASARQAKIQAAESPRAAGPTRSSSTTVVVVVLIIAAVVVGVVWSQQSRHGDHRRDHRAARRRRRDRARGRYPAFSHGKAGAGAPTVDLYEDFQCPICGQFEALGAPIRALARPAKIKLVTHTMTFLDDNLQQRLLARAASAAACAADAGKFGPYHDAVYAGQPAKEGRATPTPSSRASPRRPASPAARCTTWQSASRAGSTRRTSRRSRPRARRTACSAPPPSSSTARRWTCRSSPPRTSPHRSRPRRRERP